MSTVLDHQQFAARLGHPCTVRLIDEPEDGATAVAAVLHQVGEAQVRDRYQQFAVLIRREDEHAPQQGLYEVRFADAEPMALLLVPVARDGRAVHYEACFNREADLAASG